MSFCAAMLGEIMSKEKQWWGETAFAVNEIKEWSIGKRKIALQRLEKEWLVWNQELTNESSANINIRSLKTTEDYNESPYSRHLLNQTEDSIIVVPMLADRPIVARPATLLNILPGEQIQLYVSSPLWFCLKTTDHSVPMLDIPFFRPSDSWFGPSTMEGELCYAKYTDAKVDLSKLEKRAHRAITKVLIINQHTETLKIERINLPVPFLTLYEDNQLGFWTQEVEITHNSDNDKAGLRLRKRLPEGIQSSDNIVSNARQMIDSNHFVKSIKHLLS
jgi:hypothetical protein